MPLLPVSLKSVEALIQKGFDQTTKGQFAEAKTFFQEALRSIVMLAVTQQSEVKQVQNLIKKLVEYITAMRIEIERRRLSTANGDVTKICELACLMTLC